MPTFKRTEVVDARQFTGGLQQGSNLALWVNSNDGRAYWKEATTIGGKHLSERIALQIKDGGGHTFNDHVIVWVNDYIVRHQDGSWEAMRPELFHEEYEEV